jgi:hypothetical protein
MAVRLNPGFEYLGHLPGTVQQYRSDVEAGLISARSAVNAAGPITAGNQTTQQTSGRCAIAAGQSSVTITCPFIDVGSVVAAHIAQSTADTTATHVTRVVPAQGSVQIFVNANATAIVTIAWALLD